jgi:hypothetical protein
MVNGTFDHKYTDLIDFAHNLCFAGPYPFFRLSTNMEINTVFEHQRKEMAERSQSQHIRVAIDIFQQFPLVGVQRSPIYKR